MDTERGSQPENEPQDTGATGAGGPELDSLLKLRTALMLSVALMAAMLLLLLVQRQQHEPELPDYGGSELLEVVTGGGRGVVSGDPADELAYTVHSFGPGSVYSIKLPATGGGVIPRGDSDWPLDERVALVWHGYASTPLQDIVVRIYPLESATPEAFERWLERAQQALRSNIAYEPEGELTGFETGGRQWHNLPLSCENKRLGRREAMDVNMTQFGHDALSISFHFELPPAEGIVERLIPRVLASVESTLEQRQDKPQPQ